MDVADKIHIVANKLLYKASNDVSASDEVSIEWSPSSFISKEDTNIDLTNLRLYINLYQIMYNNNIISLNPIDILKNQDLIEDGKTKMTLYSAMPKDLIFPAIIFANIHVINEDTGLPVVVKDIGQWTRPFWIIWQNSNVNNLLWEECQNWNLAEPPSVYNNLLQTVYDVPCPPTIGQARIDNSGLIQDNTDIDFFHTQATNCFKQRIVTR